MKASKILTASNVFELKSFGSYSDIKSSLETELGNKLGVKDWESFFSKVQSLKETVTSNKEVLVSICEKGSFKDSKKEISEILKLKITARGWRELKSKVSLIITIFCSSVFDPYEYYEKTKLKKFKDSSKLEGIDIEFSDENISLESVLAKYKR